MSAEPIRHKDAPEKRGPSAIPQAYVSWMQALGRPESSAPTQEPASVAVEPAEPAPHGPPCADDTLANLFRAIEGTEFARTLAAAAPPAMRQTQPPRFAEPPDISESLPDRVEPPPPAAVPRRSPSAAPRKTALAEPNPTLLVQSPSHAASAPPMPRPGAPWRRTAPAEPPRTVESLPNSAARIVPPPPVPRKAALAGHPLTLLVQTAPPASTWLMPPAPKSAEPLHFPVAARALPPKPVAAEVPSVFNSPRLSRSVEDGLAMAPVFAPINDEENPLAANAALAVKNMRRASRQLSIRLKNWIATDAAPAAMRLGRAAMRLFLRLSNRVGAGLASTTKSIAHASTQLSTRLMSWIAMDAAPATRRAGRATTQIALRLTNFAASSSASATKHIAHAGAQLSTALGNWVVSEAVPATRRVGRAVIQLSLQLTNFAATSTASAVKHFAHAGAQLSAALRSRFHTEPALATQQVARTRTQHSSRFENWFGPRRSPRLLQPPVVAWCWAADTPQSLGIANISSGGLYLLTTARWPLGGTVPMTLQRTDRPKNAPESWIVIDFRVVRWCQDGVAGALIPPTPYSVASGTENCADQKSLKRFVKQLARPAHR